jgi:hypothetical protein
MDDDFWSLVTTLAEGKRLNLRHTQRDRARKVEHDRRAELMGPARQPQRDRKRAVK